MDPKVKKPLTIFSFQLKTWPEFCVIKAIADYAEILQVEDLLHCSFRPLRDLVDLDRSLYLLNGEVRVPILDVAEKITTRKSKHSRSVFTRYAGDRKSVV